MEKKKENLEFDTGAKTDKWSQSGELTLGIYSTVTVRHLVFKILSIGSVNWRLEDLV